MRELRHVSKLVRKGLPRIIDSTERRQRALESRVDVLACGGIPGASQETGDENVVIQNLKAIHDDLEQLKYKVGAFSAVQSTVGARIRGLTDVSRQVRSSMNFDFS